MNYELHKAMNKTDKAIRIKKQKDKKRKDDIKLIAWSLLMILGGMGYSTASYELQVFRADYLTATGHATRIIENRRNDQLVEPKKESTNGHEQPTSQEETTQDTSLDGRTVSMSAYTSHVNQTDASPCISADNTNICEYKGCVVASNDYPLGTKIAVDGFGTCTVKDRMNQRYTGTGNMDIYFGMDVDKALQFGRQEVKIAVVS